jgi:UDP-N-acetylglucosamine diphosphorylase/glucosamine-1-phosphate N-acetyltransferase
MKLVIFEDDQSDRFLPLVHTRAVFELRAGATTLREKIERAVGLNAAALITRAYVAAAVQARAGGAAVNDTSVCRGEETLFVNACVRGSKFTPPQRPIAQWRGDRLVAWRTTEDVSAIRDYATLWESARRADRAAYEDGWYDYIWDIMLTAPEEIITDFEAAGRDGVEGQVHESVVIYGPPHHVYVGKGTRIHPFVCIDTRGGPVTIEADCEVQPFTRIEGPCYVGAGSILLGAKLREGCSIGPMCRVGGEVEEAIIHGHSNKYHDGFLGHAYVGEWVNLGALTSNSDLKNDYGSVSVILAGKTIDTGSKKVGAFIGDHVKTSVGTLLNTGTIVGTAAVLVADGAPLPKYIPPFAWYVGGSIGKGYGLSPTLKTARVAMSRRKVEMSVVDEELLACVFQMTETERNAIVRRARRAAAAKA